MSKADRIRVDYLPGPAALEALQRAQEMHSNATMRAFIDRLVITGLSALAHGHWKPPSLYGRDRELWQLHKELRQAEPTTAP